MMVWRRAVPARDQARPRASDDAVRGHWKNGRVTTPLVQLLRHDLDAARYSVTTVGALWGDAADAALHRGERVPAVRALDAARERGEVPAAATLARLFILGLNVSRSDLDAALPALGASGAEQLDLVTQDGSGESIRPLLDLRPYSFVDAQGAGSWWIASDLGELALGHALGEDHVLGVGGASMTLSGLMVQRPVDSALDLGTGCGIQAMHAARHARRVVATDISERALEIARFNAELNGIENIEFRLGSLFEPVAGERFDHIVSNPPFVITPRVNGVPEYEYRDGGMIGDGIVEAVIKGCSVHLTPGGIAQMLGNWEYRTDTHAFDRIRGWLTAPDVFGEALDAWIIERDTQTAAEYAETWIRDGGTRSGTPDFDRLYNAWLDDFAARDVRQIGFGYVTLRRPAQDAGIDGSDTSTAPLWNRLERLHGSLGANEAGLGVHIESCLAGHDWQAGRDDAALAASTLLVSRDVTEERHYWPGAEDPTAMTLRQGGGFGRMLPLDTGLAAFVGACDGTLPVGVIVSALAQLLEVDERALGSELLPRVRELLDDAFLVPADASI